jgi:hypothetical protein
LNRFWIGRLIRVNDVCDGADAGMEGIRSGLYGTGRIGEAVDRAEKVRLVWAGDLGPLEPDSEMIVDGTEDEGRADGGTGAVEVFEVETDAGWPQ